MTGQNAYHRHAASAASRAVYVDLSRIAVAADFPVWRSEAQPTQTPDRSGGTGDDLLRVDCLHGPGSLHRRAHYLVSTQDAGGAPFRCGCGRRLPIRLAGFRVGSVSQHRASRAQRALILPPLRYVINIITMISNALQVTNGQVVQA